MSTPVQITFIICATFVVLALLNKNGKKEDPKE